MKPAEVETSVALPGTRAVDHAMLVVELVISLSKAGHECSRSIDASRAALRRPRFASRSSISGRMPRLFLLDFQWMSTRTCQQRLRGWQRRAAPREQAAPQADWMDEEAWQAVRTKRRVGFFPRAWLKTFFSQWRHGMRPAVEARRSELRRDLEGLARLNLQIAWCRHGMEAQAKAASKATWNAKQRWLEGQADSMARMQETGDWAATWSAVRKLIGRRKRAFRPPAPMLGDDGKPLASLQAKANQHQRELMKEFGANCVEFSEAEHLAKVRADKQAAPVESHRAGSGSTSALPSTELEWEDALRTLAKPKSGRACGSSRQAARVTTERWVLCVPRCPERELRFSGTVATWRQSLANQDHSRRATREECCAPAARERKMYASVLRAAAVNWLFACQRACRKLERFEAEERNSRLFSSWAQLRMSILSAAIMWTFAKQSLHAPFLLRRLWDL